MRPCFLTPSLLDSFNQPTPASRPTITKLNLMAWPRESPRNIPGRANQLAPGGLICHVAVFVLKSLFDGTQTIFGEFILPDMKCSVLSTCAEISSPTTVPLEIVKRDPDANRQRKHKNGDCGEKFNFVRKVSIHEVNLGCTNFIPITQITRMLIRPITFSQE